MVVYIDVKRAGAALPALRSLLLADAKTVAFSRTPSLTGITGDQRECAADRGLGAIRYRANEISVYRGNRSDKEEAIEALLSWLRDELG